MSKKRTHKRRKDNRQERLKAFQQKFQANELFTRQKVLMQTGSGDKMSEVLRAFMEPYQEFASTRDAYERLITIAVVAWNAALLPRDERKGFIDEASKSILASAGTEAVEDFRGIVDELIKRKERLFANNRRYIIDYELSETKNDWHLSVVSTM